MKAFFPLRLIAVAGSILVASDVAFAQMNSSAGSSAGVDAILTRLFGDVKAFSSKCDMRMLDASQKETMSMPLDFALLDGKIRAEVDLTQMKSKDMPPGAADQMKQFGMDRVVSIMRPDKKSKIIIYPNLKSCVNMPLPQAEVDMLEKDPKIEKSSLGKETIDGHPCIKSKLVVTDMQGKTHECIVWNANDLKNFPIQIQTTEEGTTTVMLFKQIQLAKPDASKFNVPADHKQYDDTQSLIQAVMAKMTGGAGAK